MNVQIHQTPFFIRLPQSEDHPEEFLNLAAIHSVGITSNPLSAKIIFWSGDIYTLRGLRAAELIKRLENLPGCKFPDDE